MHPQATGVLQTQITMPCENTTIRTRKEVNLVSGVQGGEWGVDGMKKEEEVC